MIRPTVRDKLLPDALRQGLLQSVLVFALSAARVGGIYAPWALAAAAVSGGKSRGLWALLGAGIGALVFFDFQTGLRFAASAVLIYSANMAFCDTKMYARKGFAPLLAALALLLVQSVYLVGRSAAQWALGVSASAVAAAGACGHETEYVFERHSVRHPRDKKEIGISAVRGGTIVGEHEIIFAGHDEVMEIRHTALSREIFAQGAVEAAKFMAGVKAPGLYDMSSLIR